jgi:hypothetical protein
MSHAAAREREPESVAELRQRLERLEARAAKLEIVDGLLRTLTGVLDIREVFARVSELAAAVLPHDALGLPLVTEDREHVRPFATIGIPPGTLPPILPLPPSVRTLMATPWEFQIFDDIQTLGDRDQEPMVRAGYRSVLRVPIRFEGRMAGALIFFSRTSAAYSEADVPLARRIADHVTLALSHQRLADEARRNDELRARSAHLDLLDQVLTSLTDTGVLPEVWERISNAAQNVLAHDGLFLTAVLPGKTTARIYAAHAPARGRLPEIVAVPPGIIENLDWDFQIVDDLQIDSAQREGDAAKQGYRSALRVPIRLSGEYVAGISFLSFTPGIYTPADVVVGRRIADRVTVSFARERTIALSKRAEEAMARASKLEQRVRALTEESPPELPLAGQRARAAQHARAGRHPVRGRSHHARPSRDPPPVIAPPVPVSAPEVAPPPPVSAADLQSMERTMIEQALHKARFNKSKAARALGLTRQQFYVRLRRHGLD